MKSTGGDSNSLTLCSLPEESLQNAKSLSVRQLFYSYVTSSFEWYLLITTGIFLICTHIGYENTNFQLFSRRNSTYTQISYGDTNFSLFNRRNFTCTHIAQPEHEFFAHKLQKFFQKTHQNDEESLLQRLSSCLHGCVSDES